LFGEFGYRKSDALSRLFVIADKGYSAKSSLKLVGDRFKRRKAAISGNAKRPAPDIQPFEGRAEAEKLKQRGGVGQTQSRLTVIMF